MGSSAMFALMVQFVYGDTKSMAAQMSEAELLNAEAELHAKLNKLEVEVFLHTLEWAQEITMKQIDNTLRRTPSLEKCLALWPAYEGWVRAHHKLYW